jgi:hypothetical protein
MFDMATDSAIFRTYEQLEAEGCRLQGNTFLSGEETFVPLYEAKMIHHFDHRYGDYADHPTGSENTSLPEVPVERLQDADYAPLPRYWVPVTEVNHRLKEKWDRSWLLGWRDICRSTDERTLIAGTVPRAGVGDKFLLMFPRTAPSLGACLLANLSSFCLDYVSRQKLGGTSLKYFTMRQLPVLPPSLYVQDCPWNPQTRLSDWLNVRALELACTATDLADFGRECGCGDAPFRWDKARRPLLRAELDACFFHLYGVPRDDVDHVMETFHIVKRDDVREHGDYRTKLVILDIYDRMQRAIATGEPYQTVLDPPPADPRVAHPPREDRKGARRA